MPIITILIGASLLFFGRKVYWLFAASAGFVAGLTLAGHLFQGTRESIVLIIAIGLGLVGILLAVFFQRAAIGIAGFLAGGYLILSLASAVGLEQNFMPLLAFLSGGILGTILISLLFDWALITLSSLAGAALILKALDLQRGLGLLIFLTLLVLGFSVQARAMRKERGKKEI